MLGRVSFALLLALVCLVAAASSTVAPAADFGAEFEDFQQTLNDVEELSQSEQEDIENLLQEAETEEPAAADEMARNAGYGSHEEMEIARAHLEETD